MESLYSHAGGDSHKNGRDAGASNGTWCTGILESKRYGVDVSKLWVF
jgi:hypothetical protein